MSKDKYIAEIREKVIENGYNGKDAEAEATRIYDEMMRKYVDTGFDSEAIGYVFDLDDLEADDPRRNYFSKMAIWIHNDYEFKSRIAKNFDDVFAE